MKNIKTCAIIGSTYNEIGFDEKAECVPHLKSLLVETILKLIDSGCETIVTSLSFGVELWAAEVCVMLRKSGCPISLIGVRIDEELTSDWPEDARERYFDLVEECDDFIEEPLYDFDLGEYNEDRNDYFSEDYIIGQTDMIVSVGKDLGARANRILDNSVGRSIRIE